jgi:hypothetical protein
MLLDLKQTGVRLLARRPVYRLLPPGAFRACAALLYHAEHSSPDTIAGLVRSMDGIPVRYLTPAVIAARAAFRAGQDDLVETTLDALERRYPESVPPALLRADLRTYQGDAEAALRSARRAQLLRPSAVGAAARVVRLGYRVLDPGEADHAAAAAVRRFPRTGEVLWAAAKACRSPEQYTRLTSAWRQAATGPTDLLRAVRPLALAAARSGDVAEAVDLYRRAITLLGTDGGARPVTETTLAGRGAWSAIEDLVRAFDGAGIPFFFAAGTALGLVREGRPLSADSDIDLGILADDWDRDALVEVFTRHPHFDLDPHPQTQKVGVRHRGGSPIDVFRFYPEGGRVWHDGVFVRWHNSPFDVTRREVRSLAVPLPADTDRYLNENYGDWRTPNPAFDAFTEDAPNLEVTWPEYQRLHLFRRAFKKAAAGDAAGARRELARAGETELVGGTGL